MTSPSPSLPITDRVKRAFKIAAQEQQRLRHPVMTAEHILLGLLDDKRALASFVLRELKVDVHGLETLARADLGKGAPDPTVGQGMLLLAAAPWVSVFKQGSIGTEHLLLGMITTGSPVAGWLRTAGVTEADARATTERLLTVVPRGSGAVERPEE